MLGSVPTYRLLLLMLGVLFAGCTDMYDQAKYKPLDEAPGQENRMSSRPVVEGTVARGTLQTDELLTTGRIDGQLADVFPMKVTSEVMARGQDRFNTFCSPCHGRVGDGRGIIVQRGFPQSNSFHADSIRVRPAGHYFDVMTNGFGRMYSYAASIPLNDRWAIAAYIRALQLSQRVSADGLSSAQRKTLSVSAP